MKVKWGCQHICKCKFDIDLNGASDGKVMALIPKGTHMQMAYESVAVYIYICIYIYI